MTTNQIENAKTLLFTDKEQYLRFKKLWAKNSQSWMSSKYHMLYNIVRGHDTSRGFTFVTKPTKLRNGFRINGSEYSAWREVCTCMQRAKNNDDFLQYEVGALIDDEFTLDWWRETLNKIFDAGQINVKALDSNFAKGGKIAQAIIKHNAKPITYQDLWDLYEEAA